MRIIAQHPEVALPQVNLARLCHQMADSWRQVEGNGDRGLSRLAELSIRSLIAKMLTARYAGTGVTRWANLVMGTPVGVATFAALYPQARFVCFYRSCLDSIYAGLANCPWGLTGYGYDKFVTSYPGNSVAALADYWVTHTDQAINFERAHPDRCMRVRYEDFHADTATVIREVSEFFGLGPPDELAKSPDRSDSEDADVDSPMAVNNGSMLPINNIAVHLRSNLSRLSREIGYPPIF